MNIDVTPAQIPVTVYEPFDYPLGPLHQLPTNAIGLLGKWNAVSNQYTMTSNSLTYTAFPFMGNKLESPRWGRTFRTTCDLNSDVMRRDEILKDGHELWFSFYLGYSKANRTNGVLDLGLMSKEDSTKASVGMRVKRGLLHAVVNNEAGDSKMTGRRSAIQMPDDDPHLIVGKVIWGKSPDAEDSVEIYRVMNIKKIGPVKLKTPISVQKGQLDQSHLDTLYIQYSERFMIDEIRVGPSYESVLMGTINND